MCCTDATYQTHSIKLCGPVREPVDVNAILKNSAQKTHMKKMAKISYGEEDNAGSDRKLSGYVVISAQSCKAADQPGSPG